MNTYGRIINLEKTANKKNVPGAEEWMVPDNVNVNPDTGEGKGKFSIGTLFIVS